MYDVHMACRMPDIINIWIIPVIIQFVFEFESVDDSMFACSNTVSLGLSSLIKTKRLNRLGGHSRIMAHASWQFLTNRSLF